jgi:hypothetical protein
MAVQGSLHLIAAVAEVRMGDGWAARNRLRDEALPLARRTGEGNAFYMVFGPANVTAHMVSVEMEAGEAADAIRIAGDVELAALRSVERKATHLLAVARCHAFRQDDAATLLTLLQLDRSS